MNPHSPITEIPKLNTTVVAELHKLDIYDIQDLLLYFPTRHEDYSKLLPIAEAKIGQQVSIRGKIKKMEAKYALFGRVGRADAVIADESGKIRVTWFNQPYLADQFAVGDELFLSGTVANYKGPVLQNPIYEKINEAFRNEAGVPVTKNIHTARIIPIYKLTAKLPLRTLRRAVYEALPAASQIDEYLPEAIIEKQKFLPLSETIKNLHFPETEELLRQAQKRLAFEEIFKVQLAVEQHKQKLSKQKAQTIPFNKTLVTSFLEKLEFTLTQDQKKAVWDILQDLEKPRPMNRLLEGDVGSGKTVVAFITALEVMNNNLQAALLCPTEILAQQHYKAALQYFEDYPHVEIILLTSKTALANGQLRKKEILYDEIAHGGPQLIISTHAILQKQVKFKNLAYVIIDEQHRFGVEQRAALLDIRSGSGPKALKPHLLSMSATPIPRSLKLSMYGDLDISQIKQKPTGRKPVFTKLVKPDERTKAYKFIYEQITQGRQVFVVTPLIEESDKLGVKAATTEYKNLQKIFGGTAGEVSSASGDADVRVGLLHGRMKSPEKEEAMRQFLANEIQILVSTSVIEVGVDVPNAAVMVIEGADRFGLAQLHQFRGRVGRAEHQSYCLLFTESLAQPAIDRLEKFSKITDGFELAKLDLQIRGYGTLYGLQQSGFTRFKYFSFSENRELLDAARNWAKKILDSDPELEEQPQLIDFMMQETVHFE